MFLDCILFGCIFRVWGGVKNNFWSFKMDPVLIDSNDVDLAPRVPQS